MIIVADTTPIHYFAYLGKLEILRELYGEIHIPSVVLSELSDENTPPLIRAQLEHLPSWFVVKDPAVIDSTIDLDAGEVAAISLALEMSAGLLLTDDRRAVMAGRMRKLEVVGTLGILMIAHRRGFLDFAETVRQLRQSNFRVTDEVVQDILRDLADN